MKNQELFNEIECIIQEKGYGWTMGQGDSIKKIVGKLKEQKSGYWLNGRFIKDEEVA